jgi:hypothetical protein
MVASFEADMCEDANVTRGYNGKHAGQSTALADMMFDHSTHETGSIL